VEAYPSFSIEEKPRGVMSRTFSYNSALIVQGNFDKKTAVFGNGEFQRPRRRRFQKKTATMATGVFFLSGRRRRMGRKEQWALLNGESYGGEALQRFPRKGSIVRRNRSEEMRGGQGNQTRDAVVSSSPARWGKTGKGGWGLESKGGATRYRHPMWGKQMY